jgi:hypothetical protein
VFGHDLIQMLRTFFAQQCRCCQAASACVRAAGAQKMRIKI